MFLYTLNRLFSMNLFSFIQIVKMVLLRKLCKFYILYEKNSFYQNGYESGKILIMINDLANGIGHFFNSVRL